IVVALFASFFQGWLPVWSSGQVPADWIVAAIVLAISIVVVTSVVRFALWGLWGSPYPYRHWRHYYRHQMAPFPYGYDPAMGIARERFARGEITQDQYESIVRQLTQAAPPLMP
ncbi:MAG TPA: hypothetical protein VEY07_06010, partial [Thermoplasmata archaeon]|nr:hypothetical protein [Thermoplasmata archaeon]